MRTIKGKVLFLLLAFLLVASGCAKAEEISETATVAQTDTATEQDTESAEVKAEPEAETEKKTEDAKAESEPEKEAEDAKAEVKPEKETEDAKAETETEAETKTKTEAESETEEAEKETAKIEYDVTQMEETSMYAKSAVNVRQGPSTDFERVGALKGGQEVKVTGQASTGWYEIIYGEAKAYVSNNYLQNEPVPVQPAPAAPSNTAPAGGASNIILIGDSRTAEMKNCVGENSYIWIAEYSTGIKWFVNEAVPEAEPQITQGTKVIINLGANDPQKVDTYIYTINEVAARWTGKGATVYYATVGPCYQNPYHTIEEAANFNAALQNGVTGVQWIDLYSYLVNNGYATREGDGFHYDPPTYARIYSYYMSCIR